MFNTAVVHLDMRFVLVFGWWEELLKDINKEYELYLKNKGERHWRISSMRNESVCLFKKRLLAPVWDELEGWEKGMPGDAAKILVRDDMFQTKAWVVG